MKHGVLRQKSYRQEHDDTLTELRTMYDMDSLLQESNSNNFTSGSVFLDAAVSSDDMLLAVLVTVNRHSSIVWLDIRNQLPPNPGTSVGSYDVRNSFHILDCQCIDIFNQNALNVFYQISQHLDWGFPEV